MTFNYLFDSLYQLYVAIEVGVVEDGRPATPCSSGASQMANSRLLPARQASHLPTVMISAKLQLLISGTVRE